MRRRNTVTNITSAHVTQGKTDSDTAAQKKIKATCGNLYICIGKIYKIYCSCPNNRQTVKAIGATQTIGTALRKLVQMV